MSSSTLGLMFLMAFALSQGVRDAYFGHVFQSVSVLHVAVLAFGLSCICFTLLAGWRRWQDLRRLLQTPGETLVLGATTAAAWLLWFYALRYLEPAIVATIHNGIGALIVLAMTRFGWVASEAAGSWIERLCYMGTAAALIGLGVTALAGQSGMAGAGLWQTGVAIAAVALSGSLITVSYLIARRLAISGIGDAATMAARFWLAFPLALILQGFWGTTDLPPVSDLVGLGIIAFILIVLPSFCVQLGVNRTSPLTANVFRALGPVCVFAVQQFDGRLQFSAATLVCIIFFCGFTITASLIRSRRELR